MTAKALLHPDEILPVGDTLDVRRPSEFRIGHFASAVSCPLDLVAERLHLLPERNEKLWVFAGDDEIEAAVRRLGELGFTSVAPHPAASPFASPREMVSATWTGGVESRRLWRPTPYLARRWAGLAERWSAAGRVAPKALDLACGSGRDAVWLALGGCRVLGIDRLPDALERARERARLAESALAARRQKSGTPAPEFAGPDWAAADLEAGIPVPDGAFDLVVCARFLHRPAFPWIASAIAPGGTLVYTTFTKRQLAWGKPTRAAHLLEDGELRSLAEAAGLVVLDDEEASPPGGPALASLWAEKPSAGSS